MAHCDDSQTRRAELEETDLEWAYRPRSHGYRIKIDKIDDYKKNKTLIESLIKEAMERKNVEF